MRPTIEALEQQVQELSQDLRLVLRERRMFQTELGLTKRILERAQARILLLEEEIVELKRERRK